jgi:hypothetical protein
MVTLLGMSIAACVISILAARSKQLHRFIWEEQMRFSLMQERNEELFVKRMAVVLYVMAGTAALIAVLAGIRILL